MSKRPTGARNAQIKKSLKEKFNYKLVRVTGEYDVEDLTSVQLDVFERRYPSIAARWVHGEDAPVSWQQQCQRILKGLMSAKIAASFTAPVDPVKLNLPTYFQIIKKPMDLGTVSRHLSGGFYHSPEEFRDEVHTTFNNAMLFNPPGNLVHEYARRLKTTFDRKFSQVHLPSAPGGHEWGEGGATGTTEGGVGELPDDRACASAGDGPGEASMSPGEASMSTDAAAAAVQSEMEALAMELEPEDALRPVLSDEDSDADSDKDGSATPAADVAAAPGGASASAGSDSAVGEGASAEGQVAGEANGAGGKQPATGGKQPARGGVQPSWGGKQPVAAGKRPAMGGKGAASLDEDDDASVAEESEIGESEMDASENASEADASEVDVSDAGDGDEQVSESDLFDDDDDEGDYADGDELGSEMRSEQGGTADRSLGDGGGMSDGNGANGGDSYPPSEADDSEAGEPDDFAFGRGAG